MDFNLPAAGGQSKSPQETGLSVCIPWKCLWGKSCPDSRAQGYSSTAGISRNSWQPPQQGPQYHPQRLGLKNIC